MTNGMRQLYTKNLLHVTITQDANNLRREFNMQTSITRQPLPIKQLFHTTHQATECWF